LLSGGEVFGALMLGSGNTGLFQESQSPVLQQIADAVALSVENSLLFQAEREQRKLAEALEEAAAAVSSTLEPDQVLDRILEQVERVVAGDAFNIMLIEEGTVRMVRWRGYERLGIEKRIAHFSAPVVELPSLVQMVQTGEPAVIPDTSADPDWALLEGWEWLRSYVGALIRVGGVTVGVLNVDGTRPGQFGPADAHRLKVFADHAAAAIENARLFEQAQQEIAERKRAEGELQQSLEQLRKTFEGTVDVLKSTIEIRDPYTAGHQQQVTQLAHAIASEMGLPEKQIEGIRVAGMIHDIGKISVPAQILSKPGELNILEYGLIKQHPRIGYDLLKTIDFPWPVAQIVLQHHERMDGSGYPAGLSGDKIMLEARILAVADVVAAMSSHRPYRSALGIDKALEEISQNRGVLYDAEVVDVCLKLFTEKRWEFN
jgi:putative nucleotidyltransferase with HDIG domain